MSDEEKKDTSKEEQEKDTSKEETSSSKEKSSSSKEETSSSSSTKPSGRPAAEVAALQGMQAGMSFLRAIDAPRAKLIFIVGLAMFFLLSFIQNGKEARISALQSEKNQLNLKYDGDFPTPPAPPLRPDADWYKDGEKSDAYTSDLKDYKEERKKYQETYKKYTKEDLPAYNKEKAEYNHKMNINRSKYLNSIERRLERKRVYRNSWAYFHHLLRYLSILIMALGACALMFHGSDMERAAALFFLSYAVVGLLRY